MTRWLVTGAAGALGRDLVSLLDAAGETVTGRDRGQLDVTRPEIVRDALAAVGSDVVINTAAYTRVDDAESDADAANELNGVAPGILAEACAQRGTRLIHLSTDYVFAGDADEPYDVDAPTGPRSVYGASKLMGEAAVLSAVRSRGADAHVVRTAWLYSGTGPSFVRSVGRRLRAGEPVDVVTDQRGAPTWTRDLARRLITLGTADVGPGVWHCSAGGTATWFDVAVAVAEEVGADPSSVRPTTTAAMARPAARPAYSVLSARKWVEAGLPAMPHWRSALRDAFRTLGDALTE
ncbi:MAG TPA: dTDP-4-dehydrorhamnose reductase [Mycobacteriales bacterium]|nr:dTDP-4-dehydrorhamnose reductase [Mycobacteriales bacterium]